MVNFFYLDSDPKKCARSYCDRHVNKIMIELSQLLSKAHIEYGKKTPPYINHKNIHTTLGPYTWIVKSIGNYLYGVELAHALLNEYRYRYEKTYHKTQDAIFWLMSNIPNRIPKGKRTPFIMTKNTQAYSKHIPNVVDAGRYAYVDYKCDEDGWTKRGKPDWFDKYLKKSEKKKKKLRSDISKNVREHLPNLSKKHNLRVRRFHSFLRLVYDDLFQDKWNRKVELYSNMYNPKKPLITQLGYGHLLHIWKLTEAMLKSVSLIEKLNQQSLKYRGKLV